MNTLRDKKSQGNNGVGIFLRNESVDLISLKVYRLQDKDVNGKIIRQDDRTLMITGILKGKK